MEFKFRAAHNRPVTHSSSASTIGPLSEQALRGGYLNASPTQNSELRPSEVLPRQIEKEGIREVIIEELERRRWLEAEVRRELIIEEELAMRGLSFEERLAARLNPRIFKLFANEFDNRLTFLGLSVPTPQSRAPEAQPAVKDNKDKLIAPAKPDSNLCGAKCEAATPPAGDPSELPAAGLKKKPREEEWSCALCQVSAASEKIFTGHLQGKKHKAKVAGLKTQKMAAKKPVDTTLPEENGMKKKLKFWCEICEISANSAGVMETHKKGKKHWAQLQLQKHVQNYKPREEEWSCALCQVRATNEKGLNEHLKGKKHQAKAAGLRIQTMAKKPVDATSPEENGTKEKFKFWCEICEISANSAAVMKTHKKGKRHLAQHQKQVQNGKVVPSYTYTELSDGEESKNLASVSLTLSWMVTSFITLAPAIII